MSSHPDPQRDPHQLLLEEDNHSNCVLFLSFELEIKSNTISKR